MKHFFCTAMKHTTIEKKKNVTHHCVEVHLTDEVSANIALIPEIVITFRAVQVVAYVMIVDKLSTQNVPQAQTTSRVSSGKKTMSVLHCFLFVCINMHVP